MRQDKRSRVFGEQLRFKRGRGWKKNAKATGLACNVVVSFVQPVVGWFDEAIR